MKENSIPPNWKSMPVLKVAQVAAITTLSVPTIYRLAKQAKLDLVKIGERSSGITTASVVRYLKNCGVEVF